MLNSIDKYFLKLIIKILKVKCSKKIYKKAIKVFVLKEIKKNSV